ncbi:energy-coupling factor transporter ATP-binding protein EcfA2 [Anaerotaenia torta]|uniref:hypothetical protein n=1 Tax=Anaerotaenia torta TaxID=433293 RepID=UPI003D20FDF3
MDTAAAPLYQTAVAVGSVFQNPCLKHCYMVMQDVNHQLFAESVLDEVLLSMEREDTAEAERILDSLHLLELKDLHPMIPS